MSLRGRRNLRTIPLRTLITRALTHTHTHTNNALFVGTQHYEMTQDLRLFFIKLSA